MRPEGNTTNTGSVTAAVVMGMLGLCLVGVVLSGLAQTVDEGGAALAGRRGTIQVESCSPSKPGFECSGPFTPSRWGPDGFARRAVPR